MAYSITRETERTIEQPEPFGYEIMGEIMSEKAAIEEARARQAWTDRGWCTAVYEGKPDSGRLVAIARFDRNLSVYVKRF